jgi:hypothetical protein
MGVDMGERADLEHEAGDATSACGCGLLVHQVDQRRGERNLMHEAQPPHGSAVDGRPTSRS